MEPNLSRWVKDRTLLAVAISRQGNHHCLDIADLGNQASRVMGLHSSIQGKILTEAR